MALEAEIYSQDLFGYAPLFKDYYGYGYGYGFQQQQEEDSAINKSGLLGILDDQIMMNDSIATPPAPMQLEPIHGMSNCWDCCYCNNHHQYSSSPEPCAHGAFFNPEEAVAGSTSVVPARRKQRRRTKNAKNEEEIESQRMTHIAVERNRRKQMNDYLALLRSLMPSSYVQRGDQASIIGGAINFVKELEQLLQAMEAQKASPQHAEEDDAGQTELAKNARSLSPLFSEFFVFPQYSTRNESTGDGMADNRGGVATEAAMGEIEVTMVESHANVKILTRKRHRQLLQLVVGLQSLRFAILHLNVTTTSDQMVLYSISLKVDEGCNLNTTDAIAAVVNQMLLRIEKGSC